MHIGRISREPLKVLRSQAIFRNCFYEEMIRRLTVQYNLCRFRCSHPNEHPRRHTRISATGLTPRSSSFSVGSTPKPTAPSFAHPRCLQIRVFGGWIWCLGNKGCSHQDLVTLVDDQTRQGCYLFQTLEERKSGSRLPRGKESREVPCVPFAAG